MMLVEVSSSSASFSFSSSSFLSGPPPVYKPDSMSLATIGEEEEEEEEEAGSTHPRLKPYPSVIPPSAFGPAPECVCVCVCVC